VTAREEWRKERNEEERKGQKKQIKMYTTQ
jgi:hypothetical protein